MEAAITTMTHTSWSKVCDLEPTVSMIDVMLYNSEIIIDITVKNGNVYPTLLTMVHSYLCSHCNHIIVLQN